MGIVSFYSSSFLGKHWPQKQGQYQKLLPLPSGKAELAHTLGLPRSLACGTFSFRRRSCLSGPSLGSLWSCFPLPRAALRVGVFSRPILFVLVLHCNLKARKGADPLRTQLLFSRLQNSSPPRSEISKSSARSFKQIGRPSPEIPRSPAKELTLRRVKRPPFSRKPLPTTTRLPLGSQSSGLAQRRRLTWRDAPVPTGPPPRQVPRGTSPHPP